MVLLCILIQECHIIPLRQITKDDMATTNVKARINDQGRIVIPAEIRRKMDLKPGETVLMDLQDGVLKIESHRARIRRIQEEFKKYAKPGILASDELIAERRKEARREMEEALG
jgi:AbrB family looped-hinge helix DNA binding protein